MKSPDLKKCRICGSKAEKLYPLKGKFSIYHCNRCNTDQLSPIPTFKEIKESTNKSYFEAFSDESVKDVKIKIFQKALKEVKNRKTQSVLEVGCANAYITEYLLSQNKQAYGLELFKDVAKRAQRKFKKKCILVGDIATYKFKRKFDLLIMFDLLEHVVDPELVLKKSRKILTKGGRILIITPNIDAFKRKVLRKHWTGYYLEHMYCYSPDTLRLLSKRVGLRMTSCKSFTKIVNVHYFIRMLSHKFPVFTPLKFITKIPFINFNFSINDDSMLVVLSKND